MTRNAHGATALVELRSPSMGTATIFRPKSGPRRGGGADQEAAPGAAPARAEPDEAALIARSCKRPVERVRTQTLKAQAALRELILTGGLTPGERLAGPNTTVFDDMRALPGLLGG